MTQFNCCYSLAKKFYLCTRHVLFYYEHGTHCDTSSDNKSKKSQHPSNLTQGVSKKPSQKHYFDNSNKLSFHCYIYLQFLQNYSIILPTTVSVNLHFQSTVIFFSQWLRQYLVHQSARRSYLSITLQILQYLQHENNTQIIVDTEKFSLTSEMCASAVWYP